MKYTIGYQGNITVIVFEGKLDAECSAEIRACFTSMLQDGHRNIVVDLNAVDFIDSSGLGALVGAFKKIRLGEGDMKLMGVQQPIRKLLRLTHLDRVFTILPGPETQPSV